MTITLQDYAAGDTNYVAKLNTNNDVLEAAIDALQSATSGSTSSLITVTTAYTALFGTTVALIGDDSYVPTDIGAGIVSVAPGYCYRPSLGAVLGATVATTLNFTGQPAATYYILIGSSGSPSRETASTEAVYSVVWTGAVFGAITRIANVVWGAADWVPSQSSSALGASYTALDDRLEAGEAVAILGRLARTWQTGRLDKALTPGSPSSHTLSAIEANNTLLNFTGALTENATVIVPLGTNPRFWIVTNNTTGAYTLTVQGLTGTGAAVTQGGAAALYQDGTNVTNLIAAAGAGTVTSVEQTVPAEFAIGGSPVTTAGTLAITKATQTANTVWSGPASGGVAQPAFRALVAADVPVMVGDSGAGGTKGAAPAPGAGDAAAGKFLKADGTFAVPAGTSSGTVTSVAQTVPAEFAIAGSPVTTSGTLAVTKATQTANTVWAGPTSGGAAQPAFRAVVAADLPVMVGDSGSGGTKGAAPAPGAGDAAAGKFLKADGTFAVPPGATSGTVTSVATSTGLTGGTITGSGTILFASVSDARVLANISGGSAAPIANTLTGIIDAIISSTQGSLLYRSATAWVALGPGTDGQRLKSQGAAANPIWVTEPYDVGGAVSGVPAASVVLIRYPFPRAVVFPTSLTLSKGVAATAATAQTDFDILKNAVSFGTMRFAAAGTTATFISAAGASFAAGDILTVVAPASPDATLASVGFSLAGTR